MLRRLSIAFIGSRGIPAKYGGNETFVEEIARRLVKNGCFNVYVTCESSKFLSDVYEDIKCIHIHAFHTSSLTIPILNDLISTIYLILKHNKEIDIFYYVATDGSLAAIIPRLLKKYVIINTDGIEWLRPLKRSSFWPFSLKIFAPLLILLFLFFEFLSVKISHIIIADSINIKNRLEKIYKIKNIVYIPYGARKMNFNIPLDLEDMVLKEYKLSANNYYLSVTRIVAENNVHKIIEGFKKAKSSKKLVIVGNFNLGDTYVCYLTKLKDNVDNILFLNPIYDKIRLAILRKNCFAYIHFYEVGGTNPSLLEQMQFKRPILAYDIAFNKEVLGSGGIFFKSSMDLANKMQMLEKGMFNEEKLYNILIKRLASKYNWDKIAFLYKNLFIDLYYRKITHGPR